MGLVSLHEGKRRWELTQQGRPGRAGTGREPLPAPDPADTLSSHLQPVELGETDLCCSSTQVTVFCSRSPG